MSRSRKQATTTGGTRTPKKSKTTRAISETVAAPAAVPTPAVDLSGLKIAIVCDWLTGTGGAERVVLELHRLFPQAPIYTSQYDRNPTIWYGDTWFADADVRTTWLQRLPKRLKKFLPLLRARAFSRLDLSQYDLVIMSSSAEAKAVKVGLNTTTIWYCHAPTHYYWSRYDDYVKHPGLGALSPLASLALRLLVRRMRRWDYAVAQRPQHIIANSTHIQQEIQKYYGRESTVVFPPVDTNRFRQLPDAAGPAVSERFGYVIAGRQTPYKRVDLAVEACGRLRLPLTVIGTGPEHDRLTATAGSSIRFLNRVTDAEMAHHFRLARAFIFPNLDDFGIVAVEALSAGTPVIAYQAGGALDYIKPGVTGSFFAEQSVDSLMAALRGFMSDDYDSAAIAEAAEAYSISSFRSTMSETVQHIMASKP